MQIHTIAPVYDENSKILILGSFPSVKSRETQFFYGHPQNRFWRVLAAVFGCETPETVLQKRQMLLENGVAVWDVIASCEITGSDDASITAVVPNDLSQLLKTAPIERIFLNGGKAASLYKKHMAPKIKIPALPLPSTSPANARRSLDSLIEAWQVIKLT